MSDYQYGSHEDGTVSWLALAGLAALAVALGSCLTGFALDDRTYQLDRASAQIQLSNALAYVGLLCLFAAPILSGLAALRKSSRRLGCTGLIAFLIVFVLLTITWGRLYPSALS